MNLTPIVTEDGSSFIPVHFLYLSPAGAVKLEGAPLGGTGRTWKVACMPHVEVKGQALPFQRSEEWRAVTCPWCKASEQYAAAAQAVSYPDRLKPGEG